MADDNTFTPGPWRVEIERVGRSGRQEWLTVVGNPNVVCRVGTPDMPHASNDARLIAQAPALLSTCEAAYLDLLKMPFGVERTRLQRTLAALRDEIAAARGVDSIVIQNTFEAKAGAP